MPVTFEKENLNKKRKVGKVKREEGKRIALHLGIYVFCILTLLIKA